MMLSAMFKLPALALGGTHFTGVPESSPLAVLIQCSRPSLESTQIGREPPKPPRPPRAARESGSGCGDGAGGGPPRPPAPRPPPEFRGASGLSIPITVTPLPHGPEVS